MLDRLIDPFRYPEFLPGVLAGAVALVAGLGTLAAGARGRWLVRRPAPIAGALLAAAALVALWWRGLATVPLVAGLALLAGAVAIAGPRGVGGAVPAGPRGLMGSALADPRVRAGAAAAVGVAGVAALTGSVAPLTSPWRWATVGAGSALVAGLMGFDWRSPHAGLATPLLLVTAGSVYATVPDTEPARVLLAVALPLAVLGWPWRLARLGPLGAALVGGLLVWVAATGGHPRPGSVVGALAAAGLLLADPLARLLSARSLLDRLPASAAGGLVIIALQTALALAAARIAGLRESVLEAALIAVGLLAVTTVALAGRPRRAGGTDDGVSRRTG